MDKSKWTTTAVALLGIGLVANVIWTKRYVQGAVEWQYSGATNPANAPASLTGADYRTPIGVMAAPRMYVPNRPGSSPDTNPGESWIQGGGASITNTTGRWAA